MTTPFKARIAACVEVAALLHGDLPFYIGLIPEADSAGDLGDFGTVKKRRLTTPSVESLVALASEARRTQRALAMGVASLNAEGHPSVCRCAWADLDDYKRPSSLDYMIRAGLPPSIRVASGRGLHAYWLLAEPTSADRAAAISAGIAAVLGTDPVGQAGRLMRMPGSFNHKAARHAEVISCHASFRYETEHLERVLAEGPVHPAPSVERSSIRGIESVRVGGDESASGVDFRVAQELLLKGSSTADCVRAIDDRRRRDHKSRGYAERTVRQARRSLGWEDATTPSAPQAPDFFTPSSTLPRPSTPKASAMGGTPRARAQQALIGPAKPRQEGS